MKPLLELKNVSIRYRMNSHGIHSVKDWFTQWKNPFQTKTIIEDLSLELNAGSSLGILGRNGAGKSTLLRAVAGIIQPARGSIQCNGTVAPILALGAGLEPELSGYENISLLLALYGKRSRESDFKKITEFSELDQRTLESPVKCYSSGMLARLAFSVSFAQDCDLYIIDEVLAVGDLGFQSRCKERISELQQMGKSFLFVSHFPDEVEKICNKGILLDDGRILFNGSAEKICREYRKLFEQNP